MAYAVPIVTAVIAAAGTATSVAAQSSAAGAQRRQASAYAQMADIYEQQAKQIAETAKQEQFWYEQNARQYELQAEAYQTIGQYNLLASQLDVLGIQSDALKRASEGLREGSAVQGQQTARYAVGGVEVSSGTPLTVLSDTARKAEEYVADVYAARDLEVAKAIMSGDIASFQAGMQEQSALFGAAGQRYAGYQAGIEREWEAYNLRVQAWQAENNMQSANASASATSLGAANTALKGAGQIVSALYSPASTTTTTGTTYPKTAFDWDYFGYLNA